MTILPGKDREGADGTSFPRKPRASAHRRYRIGVVAGPSGAVASCGGGRPRRGALVYREGAGVPRLDAVKF